MSGTAGVPFIKPWPTMVGGSWSLNRGITVANIRPSGYRSRESQPIRTARKATTAGRTLQAQKLKTAPIICECGGVGGGGGARHLFRQLFICTATLLTNPQEWFASSPPRRVASPSLCSLSTQMQRDLTSVVSTATTLSLTLALQVREIEEEVHETQLLRGAYSPKPDLELTSHTPQSQPPRDSRVHPRPSDRSPAPHGQVDL